MAINQALLPEFDKEMANTRRTLERVPDDKLAWKPHDKSMPMGRLAGHIAEMPSWAVETINKDSVDVMPAGGPPPQGNIAKSRHENLETFDKNVAAARTALASATDEHLMKTWSLMKGGQTIFSMPRIAVIRGMVMNHMIHHRAQLGVYLRLNDIPLPALYGPSADEGTM